MWAKGKSVSMRSCSRRSDAVPSVMLEKGLRFARVLGIILALSLSGNSHTALSLAQTGQIGGDHKETTPGVITTAQIKEELPVLITTAAPVTTVTPHEPPEVRSFAERQYLIASFVWSDAQARGATVGKVLVPADLAGFPVLSQKLSYFRHIRMDVDIEIRILSSAYNYGALGYAWNFGFPFPTGHADCRDWRQLWQHRSGYIPVQDREGIKFTMPWSSNRSYVQNDSWGTENGAIILFVASPLKSIDANPSDVQVQVFATMRNVIEQGPDPTTVVAVQSSRQRRKKWKKPVWEDRQRRFNEMLPDHVNDQIAAWIATGKDGDPDPSTAKPIKKEAEEKTKSGIISGFVRKVGSVATLATPIPIVGELAAGIAAGAGALAPILESFGLTKPSTLMAPTPMYDVSNLELVQGTGLSRVNRLGLMPDDFLEDPANAVPSEDWDPSVHDFVRRPGYVLAFTWTAAVATSASLQKMWVDPFLSADDAFTTNPYVVYPTPLAHMAQYYAACRGSIKYHVVFVGHQFIKGKVRISFSPSGTFYAPLEDVGGDMLSRTVDVVGTTSVDFTVPYFGVLPWYLCQELSGGKVRIPYGMQSGAFGCMTGGWGALNFSVVNPLIVTDTVVNPTVDVLVFQAAGEDFQFSRLVGRNTLLTTHQLGNAPAVRAEIKGVTKQCSIESRFKASFPGLAPGMNFNVDEGYVNHKQDMTFRTQLHRYSVTGATVGDGAIPTEPFWRNGLGGTYGEPSDASLHSEFSRLFLYWRGSMRFGYADAVSPPTGPAEYSVAPASAGGGIVFPTNRYSTGTLYVPGPDRDNEVIYLEVPWYDVVPFRAVYDDWLGPDQVQCLYSLSTDQQFIWRAIGDDFGLSCPTACPVLTFAPAALPERAGKATSSHDVTRPSRSGTPAPSF